MFLVSFSVLVLSLDCSFRILRNIVGISLLRTESQCTEQRRLLLGEKSLNICFDSFRFLHSAALQFARRSSKVSVW